jgi:hypothetical protein
MSADEFRPQIRRVRPVPKKVLPAGPARDLRDAVYLLYVEADRPQLEALAKQIADDNDLPGAPKKDLIGKVISGDGLASQQDTVTVAVALARAAGRQEIAPVADQVRRLWITAAVAQPVPPTDRLGRPIGDGDPLVLEVHPAIQVPSSGTAAVLPAYVIGSVPPLANCSQARDGLQHRVEVAHETRHVAVLSGMGGVGKTQIAARYAKERVTSEFALVVWVNADSRDGVLSGYAQAAIELGLASARDEAPAAAMKLRQELSRTTSSWLVVLDDLGDSADVDGLWPPDRISGRVLVTTRGDEDALRTGVRELIKVEVFTPTEAVKYVEDRLDSDPDRLIEVERLVEDLGCLPLALAHAAAYMQNLRLTCGEYRERFADRARSLPRVLPKGGGDEYPYEVAVTWRLSIEAANGLEPVGVAQPLLQLASELDPNGMPERIFTGGPVHRWLSGRRSEPVFKEDPRDGLLRLASFSLLTVENGVVRVHALVQRAVREQFEAERPDVLAVAGATLQQVWDGSEAVEWRVISALVRVIVEAGNEDRRRKVFGRLLEMADRKSTDKEFAGAWDATYVIREHFDDLVDLVIECLGGLRDEPASASRIGPQPRITQEAASTLAYSFTALRNWREADPDRAIPLLAEGLSWQLRIRFPTALAMYEDPRALDALLRFVRRELATKRDPPPLRAAAAALGKLGAAFRERHDDCVAALTEIAELDDRDTYRAAIIARGDLTGVKEPVPAKDEVEIIAHLAIQDGNSPSDWVRALEALEAAADLAKVVSLSPRLLDAVIGALGHRNPVVVAAAAEFLGQHDEPQAAAALQAKLNEPELPSQVETACTRALDASSARNHRPEG